MHRGKPHFAFILLFLIPAPLFSQQFGGNPSSIKWKKLNSPGNRVIFPAGLDSQARRIANISSLLSNTRANSLGDKQREWNVVLLNQTIIPNGMVRLAPVVSELGMTADQNNFNSGSLRWDDNLIIHENRHMQQFSNFNHGLSKVFGFFLGQEGQLLANGITIPDYFFEGDAVWQETLVSAQGRGRMPSFYNGMKSLWLQHKQYSWMKLRSGSFRVYTPNHYELGYQLVAYGYQQYGEDFWKKVTSDAVRFKGLFFSYNKAIERHSGQSYQQFRQAAMQYFKDRAFPQGEYTDTTFQFITKSSKHNVTDYLYPQYLNNDSILVTKQSYKELNSFYLLANGVEKKIRVKDLVIDDYFSSNNGRIIYAAYRSDPRWFNRDYSVIQLLDLQTKKQHQLSFKSKYFSPDINRAGTEVLAVNVDAGGHSQLHRINASTGQVSGRVPNLHNYFFTQSKYLDEQAAISAVRNAKGQMALIRIDLNSGETENITPFSFNVIGYPFIKGDTVYFSAMHQYVDKIFAVSLNDRQIFQLTNNLNGVYQPSVNNNAEMVFSAFTADGAQLAKTSLQGKWRPIAPGDFTSTPGLYAPDALGRSGAGILYRVPDTAYEVTKYKKGLHLFNFHSWRPEVNDPEYSYHLYSDNVLSNFSNQVSYTYNRSDRSSILGTSIAFAGWYPVLSIGGEYHFNRNLDTAVGKSVQFNSAKLNTGFSIPLSFVGGRTSKFLNFGAGYNLEQLYYRGIGEDVTKNRSVKYGNVFFSFSNSSRQARQHINPHWAQAVSLSYRDAFTLINSHKLVGNSSFYFPGLFTNHSLVINASYQKRDSLPDLFSNNFSYSRGYEALSTRRMHKFGFNYHLPLWYPDWGFGNIVFFQRVRINAFYDHTVAHARLNGVLTDIKNRSTGGELYFDTKVWNALPVSVGLRFSHLLDDDLQNPGLKNLWEIIVPIGLIPD